MAVPLHRVARAVAPRPVDRRVGPGAVLAWGPVRAGDRVGWAVLALLLLGWIAIWFIAPLVVPGTEDRAASIFAAVLAPLSLIGLWLSRPGSRR